MIGRETFEDLDIALNNINQNLLLFGGALLLPVEDFLQRPPINQKSVFIKPTKRSYKSFNGWLWEKFQQHKLVEIVRLSSHPGCAPLLSRLQEVQQTNYDLIQIKALANTWPDEFILLYLNNSLKGKESDN